MAYSEDELIDKIRSLDEEIEELEAEFKEADAAAMEKLVEAQRKDYGYYNPKAEPGAQLDGLCPVCSIEDMTFQAENVKGRQTMYLTVSSDGPGEASLVLCDATEDETKAILDLNEDEAARLGNLFLDIRSGNW